MSRSKPGRDGALVAEVAEFPQLPVTPFSSVSSIDDVEQRRFDRLPDNTWLYPGHGKDRTLGVERPCPAPVTSPRLVAHQQKHHRLTHPPGETAAGRHRSGAGQLASSPSLPPLKTHRS